MTNLSTPRPRLRLTSLGLVLLSACAGSPKTSSEGSSSSADGARSSPFSSIVAAVDTLQLPCTGRADISRVSGFAVRNGTIILTDPVGGVVVAASRDSCRAIGTRGQGPGEFVSPFSPRFSEKGELWVPDAGTNRISVYDSTLRCRARIALPGGRTPVGFALFHDERFAVAALASADSHLVTLGDSAEPSRRSLLKLADARPVGFADSPLWSSIRFPSIHALGDTLAMIVSLVDTIYAARPESEPVVRIAIPRPTSEMFTAPPTSPQSRDELRAWRRQQPVAIALFGNAGDYWVPLVRGTYYDGDPSALLRYQPGTGTWGTLQDAPPILAADDSKLWTLDVASLTDSLAGVRILVHALKPTER